MKSIILGILVLFLLNINVNRAESSTNCPNCFVQIPMEPSPIYALSFGSVCYSGTTYCGTVQYCNPGNQYCNQFQCLDHGINECHRVNP